MHMKTCANIVVMQRSLSPYVCDYTEAAVQKSVLAS